MSAQANITVFDGAATPVSHTLVGLGVAAVKKEIVASWREAVTSIPAYAQITLNVGVQRLASGVYRVAMTANVPVMESIAGQNAAGYTAAPKVAYTNKISLVCFFHERSTIAERRLARQLAVNLLGNISTSVTPVTTGPMPEAIDQLISAS